MTLMHGLTATQHLLLTAALARGDAGLDAWCAWRARTSVDTLDADSQWLLPLLYDTLRRAGVALEALARYRNVYRHNWYTNSLRVRQAEVASAALPHGAVTLIGGAAMALRDYDSLGARPFATVSLLVRSAVATRPDVVAGPAAGNIDVRTSLFNDEVDDLVTARARRCTWRTTRWSVLDPADELVAICLARRAWDARSRLLWIADAVTLVRRHQDLNWHAVVTLAARLGLDAEVAGVLAWLEHHWQLGIPAIARGGLTPASVPA